MTDQKHTCKSSLELDKILLHTLKDSNSHISDICKELVKDVKKVAALKEEELHDLWYHLKIIVSDKHKVFKKHSNDIERYEKESLELIYFIAVIAIETISVHDFISNALFEVVLILHTFLPEISDSKVKNTVSSLLEKWWTMNLVWKEKVIFNALNYLIQQSKYSLLHVKRLHDIKLALQTIKNVECIQELFKLTQEKKVIANAKGKQIIIELFSFGELWIVGLHKHIKQVIENCDHNQIKIYAEIYSTAWLNGTTENKKIIADKCLQNYIFHCLRSKRNVKGRENLGKNLLSFLHFFHTSNIMAIKKLICRLYDRLLWQHLKASGCSVRCNAADILFLAYPLSCSSNGKKKQKTYLDKQHDAITNLLNDLDSNVCLIAVKGACNIMTVNWNDLPENVVNEWLSILVNHTKNCIYPGIRMTVFHGLKTMLKNQHTVEKIQLVLHNLLDSMYDPNTDAKAAFVELLLFAREQTAMEIWNILSLTTVLECIEIADDNRILQPLAKLLENRILRNNDDENVENEIILIGQSNKNAMTQFFLKSSEIINYATAIRLIRIILNSIIDRIKCIRILKRSPCNNNYKNKKLRNGGIEENCTEKGAENDAACMDVLFQAVITLLLVNHEKISTDSSKQIEDIKTIIFNNASEFSKLIKKTPFNKPAILLLSLLPAVIVHKNQIIVGTCLEELENSDLPDDILFLLLRLLIKWKKVNNIIKLLMKLFNINKTDFKTVIDKEKLHIIETNIKLGLKLLQQFLRDELLSVLIYTYYEDLKKLWEVMGIVKDLVESKQRNDNFISDDITECFFKHYISMIILLHKEGFDASEEYFTVINWALKMIIPRVSENRHTKLHMFPTNVLRHIFDVGNKIISQHKAIPKLCCEIVLLYNKCLIIPHGIIFVSDALVTILTLLNYSESMFKEDESRIVSVIVPSLFAAVMITLTKYPANVVAKYTNGFSELVEVLPKLFSAFDYLTCKKNMNCLLYMSIIFNTAVACTTKKLTPHLKMNCNNFIEKKLPYIAENLLETICGEDKFQCLCIDVLKKLLLNYSDIDELSALIILYHMMKSGTDTILKSAKSIARYCSSKENDNRSINEKRRKVIEAILDY